MSDRPSTAVEPLHFYKLVLRVQAAIAEDFEVVFDPARSLREQIDFEFASSKMAGVLTLASEHAPKALAGRAQQLIKSNGARKEMLESAISGEPQEYPLDDFFIRGCLQPIAEKLQVQIPSEQNHFKKTCPACGSQPQLSILRPEGEGATRSLLCSFCLREWVYRRIICPSCGEEDKEKLPHYSAPQCEHIAVEACDNCMKYLKSVDMTVDGHAEPLVDEASVAALDLWATERGYTKIFRNLIGF